MAAPNQPVVPAGNADPAFCRVRKVNCSQTCASTKSQLLHHRIPQDESRTNEVHQQPDRVELRSKLLGPEHQNSATNPMFLIVLTTSSNAAEDEPEKIGWP